MYWTPIEEMTKENRPKDGSNVLLSIEGYDQSCIGGLWGDEWFLINDFEEKYKGDNGAVKVTAFMQLPKAYKE